MGELRLWQAGGAVWRSLGTEVALRALASRLRSRGMAGALYPYPRPESKVLRAWALRLRGVGLVAAVQLPVQELGLQTLETLDLGVPLLLVLAPPSLTPLRAWTDALAALASWRSSTTRVAVLPTAPCHLQGFRGDLSIGIQPGPGAPPVEPNHWASVCERCSLRARCPGTGVPAPTEADVSLQVQGLSNQFDLIERPHARSSLVIDGSQVVCPGSLGLDVEARSVGMSVVLEEAGHLRCFEVEDQGWEVEAQGWEAEALRESMELRGQLYLDRSDKARLDDFASDLRLLERIHEPHELSCAQPRNKAVESPRWCPGLWRVAPAQPFAVEEAALVEIIGGLRGTVVDVGAGPVRYLVLLREAMAAGRVRYVAVEPDADALARSARVLEGATLCQGTAEALPLRAGIADAVLFLRSYNHLRDVEVALQEAWRVLRPGGTLLMCDNVVFGLCRDPAQLARARSISVESTPFEHRRNATVAEAAAAVSAVSVSGGGFSLEQIVPVGRGTSNQWLLLATQKPSSHALFG